MNELVSVIMPSYNTAEFIEKSVKSVINQTYTNWELIIVDDCSQDNTEEILKKYLADKRIRYYRNEANLGAAISRNRALKEAKGRWIAFLDSDDLWKREKLQKQIEFMEKNEYYFSYTNYVEIDENSKLTGTVVSGPEHITRRRMYDYCWPGCLTVMYDRRKVGDIQITDIKKNNDYAMWLEVIKKTDCYLLCSTLSGYRRRQGSISNQSYLWLVYWHYALFREEEGFGVCKSICLTMNNLFWGMYKKIRYVKRKRLV